jgi:xylulokinase
VALVAGVDSSTQSCKVVVRDGATGALLRAGSATHPDGTEVEPWAWWGALQQAIGEAGGLDDVAAVSVAAQQHGLVCLAADGSVVRPALLWNDTRSAAAAQALVAEGGGAQAWAEVAGSVPVASFTVTKLRWLAEHEPDALHRTAAVCLPHDWLTWRLSGAASLATLVTDRSDASGTGYWSPASGAYRPDLLDLACGRTDLALPRVLGPAEAAGVLGGGRGGPRSSAADVWAVATATSAPATLIPIAAGGAGPLLGPGAGDNAAAALGLGARDGDVVVSLGTSGTAFRKWAAPTADATGAVAGFADATGSYLPLVCTLNAARVLDTAAAMLGVDLATLSELALSAPAGAGGLVLVPYLEGERTPNKPAATGALHGLTLATGTAACLARAAVEGMLCALADALDALAEVTAPAGRVVLIGGAAASPAVRAIAPAVFGCPVLVPEASQYVADGAARQAAWVLAGGDAPPVWRDAATELHEADPVPAVRERYAEARDLTLERLR